MGSQLTTILPYMKHTKFSVSKKKWLLIVGAVMLIALMALPFYISAYVCNQAQDRIISVEQAAELDADCILVLGARVYDNGKLSGILEDRMITGIAAYENGASDRLLVSGDHGRVEYDEVTAMKDYAVAQGVSIVEVFMDHAGFSTYDSLYRARDVFGAKKIVIATQRYHLYRALYIAEKLGLEAYGIAADLRTYGGETHAEIREIAARNKDFIMTIFTPKPTYLGDPISLAGDGRITDG